MANEADIEYILITDKDGRIIIHSQPDKIGGIIELDSAILGRIIDKDDFSRIFEIARPFILPKDELYGKMPLSHRKLIVESSGAGLYTESSAKMQIKSARFMGF
jgi:hypothetical protein